MATWDDVRAAALALPGAVEVHSRGLPQWKSCATPHRPDLRELVVQAWVDRAPRRLVAEHLGAG